MTSNAGTICGSGEDWRFRSRGRTLNSPVRGNGVEPRHLEASQAGLTLDALLEALPDDFPNHPRTIRRDLEALEVAGFPIISERIDGRVRWRIMDGFRNIPALRFSPTELMALVMSQALLKPLEGTQVRVPHTRGDEPHVQPLPVELLFHSSFSLQVPQARQY